MLLTAAIVLPASAMALPFGITQEEVDRGAMSIISDRAVSAKAIRKGDDGVIRLYDVTLSGSDKTLTTDYLILQPGGGVETGPGRIDMAAEGKGGLSFASSTYSAADLLERQIGGRSCGSEDRGMDMEPAGEASYVDLIMRTEMGIDVSVADETRMGRAEVGFLAGEGADGCLFPEEVGLRDVEVRSADGSRAEIGTLDLSIGIFGPAGSDLAVEASLADVRARQPDGAEIGAAEQIRLRGSLSPDMVGELMRIAELRGSPGFSKELSSVLRKEHLGLRHEIRGAWVNLGILLGDEQVRKLGVDPTEQIAIDGGMNATLDKGTLTLEMLNDMSGLARGSLRASFLIAPSDNAMALAGLAGAVPGIEVLGVMRLAALELDITDLGLRSKIRAATGRSASEIVKQEMTKVRHLPEEIRIAIEAWLEQAEKDGRAYVEMSPIEPVGLLDVGMAAVMNPKGLGRMLEITTQHPD
ncbi:hypothetical protein [Paracoccus sp. ME4]|uniref:hypothetical protein n=1 Tax=Paracoccus sp. ME4 TaxID=3138066 RepID=UPI00398AF8BC